MKRILQSHSNYSFLYSNRIPGLVAPALKILPLQSVILIKDVIVGKRPLIILIKTSTSFMKFIRHSFSYNGWDDS